MDYDDYDDEDFGYGFDDLGAKHRRRRSRRPRPQPKQVVQKTILVGQSGNLGGVAGAPAGAVQATITIRPQFDFVAEDLTFQGSVNGAIGAAAGAWTIREINFGDRIIFSNPVGVPIALFATGSFVRGLVKGAAIAAGLDISILGNNSGASSTTPANLIASFTGLKRGTTGCGPGAV